MKPVGGALLNGRLGKAIARVVGKPGSLRFRLARDTVGAMVIRFAMTSVEGQKARIVTIKNGFAEMHAQQLARGVVTKSGGPPGGGSRNARDEELLLQAGLKRSSAGSPSSACFLPSLEIVRTAWEWRRRRT